MAGITPNMGYLKSILGILKIVEFFLLLLAFSCMSDCCYARGYGHLNDSRVSFFLAVTVIGWLVVIGLFVFFLLNLTEKVPQVNWKLVNMITSVVLAVLLLICSSLMAERADSVSIWKQYYYYERIWNTMTAGVVFGFFSIVAFVIDAIFQFMDGVSLGGGGGGQGNGAKVSNNQNA